ncbi:GNAT family N-acetyltransferase [Candidatus Microgenomates bacterium]|nr:GNAT family N-acetyltransferase [Candidatus Microgenomates bacterium]
MQIKIRKIKPSDINWIKTVFNKRWGGEFIVTHGKIHKPEALDGFIAEANSEKKGLITFKITKKELEIISLDSYLEKRGLGSLLLRKVINLARKQKLKRIWFVTTNDNLVALRFYQKRGFNLVKVYPDALKLTRRLKPSIPLIGDNGIPLRDEIELELI